MKENETNNVNTITYNQCVNLVNHQLRRDQDDTKEYQKTAIIEKQHKLAVIIQKKETQRDLIRYLHAACFSPVPSTWIKAIKQNHFQTWPGLTPHLVQRHLPPSVATAQGHTHKQRQNLQSTNVIPATTETLPNTVNTIQDMHPTPTTPNVKEH